jgi:hypothetical protein
VEIAPLLSNCWTPESFTSEDDVMMTLQPAARASLNAIKLTPPVPVVVKFSQFIGLQAPIQTPIQTPIFTSSILATQNRNSCKV